MKALAYTCLKDVLSRLPDHSTFSKNRHDRFRQSEAFRHVFETVLRRCMSEGLVRGEGFAIDASVIKADANRARGVPGVEIVDWRKEEASSRAVREYLEALEAQNASHEDASDDQPPSTPPKSVSLTDPASRWTAAPAGPAFFAYSTNYLIDLHVGVIMDVEATPAHRSQEVDATKTMVHRVEARFCVKPQRLVARHSETVRSVFAWDSAELCARGERKRGSPGHRQSVRLPSSSWVSQSLEARPSLHRRF